MPVLDLRQPLVNVAPPLVPLCRCERAVQVRRIRLVAQVMLEIVEGSAGRGAWDRSVVLAGRPHAPNITPQSAARRLLPQGNPPAAPRV
jgi:hypothetical protein